MNAEASEKQEEKKEKRQKPTLWKTVSIVFESRVATVGVVMFSFWLIIAFVSLFWTPYEPNSSDFAQNLGPNAVNWLGTDHMGRDIVSRLMQGTQVILLKTRLPGGE
jgi:peptide/nickel transport system permease protein